MQPDKTPSDVLDEILHDFFISAKKENAWSGNIELRQSEAKAKILEKFRPVSEIEAVLKDQNIPELMWKPDYHGQQTDIRNAEVRNKLRSEIRQTLRLEGNK